MGTYKKKTMTTHSRKFLNNVKVNPSSTSAAAAAAAAARFFRSRDYYNDTRRLSRLLFSTTTTNDDGNNNSSSLTATITGKLGPADSTTDSSMGIPVAILLITVWFVGFCCFFSCCLYEHNYPNPRRRQHQSQRHRGSSSGIDPCIIQSLPLYAYDGNVKETIDCSICLTQFEEKEMIKAIPFCSHFFHPQCIDMWLSAHGSCPLCRSTQLLLPLPPPPPHPDDHKDPFSCFVAIGPEVPLAPLPPIPSSSSLSAVTRVNSFSSSSRLEDRVHSLRRSFSF